MPLTDELGEAVLSVVNAEGIRVSRRGFANGQFEAWLSRVGEDQPDLSVRENLQNRVLFEACRAAIATVLDSRLDDAMPSTLAQSWFGCLLETWHVRRSTVITFNQDVLLELAVAHRELPVWGDPFGFEWDGQSTVAWHDVLEGQPPLPGATWESVPQPTFRLLKLHGSTNWFWRPGDVSGATAACWFPPGIAPDAARSPSESAALRRALPGRSPLIVPPMAAKSAYYRTPLLSQLWQDARSALSRSRVRVSLLGYSVPVTDTVTSGMLGDSLTERPDRDQVVVDVANPCPEPVWARLGAIGVARSGVTASSIEEFAKSYVGRGAEELVAGIRAHTGPVEDCLLLVGPSLAEGHKVTAIRPIENGVCELVLEDSSPLNRGTNIGAPGSPPPMSLADLRQRLEMSSALRLVAVWPSGRRGVVVGADRFQKTSGAGPGLWQMLVTVF